MCTSVRSRKACEVSSDTCKWLDDQSLCFFKDVSHVKCDVVNDEASCAMIPNCGKLLTAFSLMAYASTRDDMPNTCVNHPL